MTSATETGASTRALNESVTRSPFTQPQFDDLRQRETREGNPTTWSRKFSVLSKKMGGKIQELYCGYSRKSGDHETSCCRLLIGFIYGLFPFIGVLRHYDIKNWLVTDIVAGFTVGVMHVPQGMAYAMLATLPPVYGLYCSMFAPFFYFFFGTSRQISMGTIAIVSLLVGGCLDRNVPPLSRSVDPNSTLIGLGNQTDSKQILEDADIYNRVMLALALTITVGLIQLGMGLLRMGFLTQFLAQPIISGFTVGSAVHVAMSQIIVAFGIAMRKNAGLFNVPINFYRICINLPNANWVTTGVALSCIAILFIFKLWINPTLSRKIKIPVPVELLIIILGAVVSYYLRLGTNHAVKIVGPIPKGLPEPLLPEIWRAGPVIGDAFVIALIAFSICFSLSSFYARKEGYKIDANQELVAYGMTNVLGAFFRTYPLAASLSRSALQASLEPKSQLVSLVSSAVLLLVILFAGPLFHDVPNCCLSAIILVALYGMFVQISELPKLWRHSIWDFASWVIAFLATVFLDVLYGLIIGISFSAISVVIRSQQPKVHVLGRFRQTEVFKSVDEYNECLEDSTIKVIRYEGSLFYAGAERFISTVLRTSGFDPRPVAYRRKKYEAVIKDADLLLNPVASELTEWEIESPSHSTARPELLPVFEIEDPSGTKPKLSKTGSNCDSDSISHRRGFCRCCCYGGRRKSGPSPLSEAMDKKRVALCGLAELNETIPLTHLILDCSAWNFIDLDGVNALKTLMVDYNDANVIVYLASPSHTMYESMRRGGLFELFEPSIVFISIFDAFVFAQDSLALQTRVDTSEDQITQ